MEQLEMTLSSLVTDFQIQDFSLENTWFTLFTSGGILASIEIGKKKKIEKE